MPVEVKIDNETNCVVIVLPMEKARPSASGKTMLIATSHGLASGEALYSGRPVMVAASAFIYPDQTSKTDKNRSGRPRRRALDLELDQPEKVTARNSKNARMKSTKTRGHLKP